MDDYSLVMKVKETGDSSAMAQIIAQHSGVFTTVLEKSLPADTFSTQRQDFLAEKSFHLYDAVMKYRPDSKMKLSTFIGQTIKWKCLSLKDRGQDKDTVFLESLDNPPPEKEEECSDKKFKIEQIFQFAENYPNETARKIVTLRYDSKNHLPWKEVSKKLGISVAQATRLNYEFLNAAKAHFSNAEGLQG